MEWVAWVIAGLATASNIIHAWTGRTHRRKKENVNGIVKNAVADATLIQKIEYIAEKIDEIQTDMGTYSYKIDKINERLTRIEVRVDNNECRIRELAKINS